MDHAAALKRVQLLVLARNAIAAALNDAVVELEAASRAEGKPVYGVVERQGRLSITPARPDEEVPTPRPPAGPTPTASGLHPRFAAEPDKKTR